MLVKPSDLSSGVWLCAGYLRPAYLQALRELLTALVEEAAGPPSVELVSAWWMSIRRVRTLAS